MSSVIAEHQQEAAKGKVSNNLKNAFFAGIVFGAILFPNPINAALAAMVIFHTLSEQDKLRQEFKAQEINP